MQQSSKLRCSNHGRKDTSPVIIGLMKQEANKKMRAASDWKLK